MSIRRTRCSGSSGVKADINRKAKTISRIKKITAGIPKKVMITLFRDLTILTAEDPRTESLDGILQEMAEGMISKGGIEEQGFWRVPDRGEAIRFALQLAKPEDVVMVCGKGHEQSMCFGETEFPWDDRTAMLAALSEYLGIDGPDMPYLPTQDQ